MEISSDLFLKSFYDFLVTHQSYRQIPQHSLVVPPNGFNWNKFCFKFSMLRGD